MNAFRMTKHVVGFTFGEPVETGILMGAKEEVSLKLPLEISRKDGHSRFSFPLTERDRVYGLGPNLGGINKRGRKYESYCTDDPLHHEDKTTLYGAHNFFILEDDDVARGYFIDFPSRIRYDVGFTSLSDFTVDIFGEDFTLLVIDGENLKSIVRNFHEVIGKPYMPPKWGLGYAQSRWGYKTAEDVRKVREAFLRHDLPLDSIYLDLDYMEDFKDFSVSEERFPKLQKLSQELRETGVHLVPIIDAGVKIEEGYDIYEEGIAGDHFVKNAQGEPYVAAVWPGKVHFPDFLQEKTQAWFGEKYKALTDLGIDGFWNDMNEPAIFYDETSLQEGVEAAMEAQGGNLGVYAFFNLRDKFQNIGNKDEYYQRFFHEFHGKTYSNEELHNLYGFYMTKSASEGLRKLLNKRFVLISRASSIGMHRYSGIWTGDNSSWWSHLSLNLRMLPALNMSGFYYVGADTGGFGGNAYGELLLRWLQLSAFTPLLRNHSALGCAQQEPYAFGPEMAEKAREVLRDRYRLIPYLYSETLKAWKEGGLMFTPLAFEFWGEEAQNAEDQMLLGEELMISPVTQANAGGRYVYLPEAMAEVTFKEDQVTLTLQKEGVRYMSYALDELKFHLRRNHLLPFVPPASSTRELEVSTLYVLGYVETEGEYELLDDDGITYGYEDQKIYSTRIRVTRGEEGVKVDVKNTHPHINRILLTILDGENHIMEKEVLV